LPAANRSDREFIDAGIPALRRTVAHRSARRKGRSGMQRLRKGYGRIRRELLEVPHRQASRQYGRGLELRQALVDANDVRILLPADGGELFLIAPDGLGAQSRGMAEFQIETHSIEPLTRLRLGFTRRGLLAKAPAVCGHRYEWIVCLRSILAGRNGFAGNARSEGRGEPRRERGIRIEWLHRRTRLHERVLNLEARRVAVIVGVVTRLAGKCDSGFRHGIIGRHVIRLQLPHEQLEILEHARLEARLKVHG
jgi:hypothetical protein